MKSLFVTLLILAGAFLAYDYFGAPVWDRMVFEKGPRPAAAPKPIIPSHVVEDDGPQPGATTTAPGEAAPATANAKPADDYVVTIPKIASDEFVAPNIQSVETVTKNWTMIPKQAFPRSIVIKKDVPVKMSVGGSVLKAGAKVQALSADNGTITIAPTEGSAARGTVAVMDTDFPDQIHESYAKWKIARIEQARLAWIAGKTARQSGGMDKSTLPNGQGITFSAEGMPVQNANGSYNLLLAAISIGQISDVDPNKVVHWGAPRPQTIDGKPTWVIDVRYEAKTIFGLMEVDSHAHVRDNRLVRWVYDSGEPLP